VSKQIGTWIHGFIDGVVRDPRPNAQGSQYFPKMAMIDPHGQIDAGEDFDDEHGYARVTKASKAFR
jgi:hypothetical protein